MRTSINNVTGNIETIESILLLPLDSELFRWLYNERSIATIKVLFYLFKMAENSTNMVHITTRKRNMLCIELEISQSMLTKAISSLKKRKFIVGSKGEYIVSKEIVRKSIIKEL